jgi:hypothetical protein
MAWDIDWAWGIPLTVLNVVIHVLGLIVIFERIIARVSNRVNLLHHTVLLIATTALMVTVLHAIEGITWAVAYRLLGALPDIRAAMLYSLSAITSYGHAQIIVHPHWQVPGALESLNGMILFGLTTAFLFGLIQKIWPLGSRAHRSLIGWRKPFATGRIWGRIPIVNSGLLSRFWMVRAAVMITDCDHRVRWQLRRQFGGRQREELG